MKGSFVAIIQIFPKISAFAQKNVEIIQFVSNAEHNILLIMRKVSSYCGCSGVSWAPGGLLALPPVPVSPQGRGTASPVEAEASTPTPDYPTPQAQISKYSSFCNV